MDQASDDTIQRQLQELEGVTILTIAHRLDTIYYYDKVPSGSPPSPEPEQLRDDGQVAVLNAGRIEEFDDPVALANREGSVFGEMWRQFNAKAH